MLNDSDLIIIKKLPLFANLENDVLNGILGNAFARDYPKGKLLFVQGEPADCFYIVLSGWVKIFRETIDGNEAVLGVFTGGESLAEAPALLGGDFPASAEVVEPSRLVPVRSALLRDYVRQAPEVAINMLASMSRNLHYLAGEVERLKTRSATLRVVDFLLRRCPNQFGPAVIALPYDKTLISGRLGIQPESLSRILAKLRKLGVRTEQNRIMIMDVGDLISFRTGEMSDLMRKAG